jgi:hypothetical protein
VELASTLALAVALVQVAMGVLRLGGLVSLISTPVVAGACAAPRRAAPPLIARPTCRARSRVM